MLVKAEIDLKKYIINSNIVKYNKFKLPFCILIYLKM